MLVLCVLLCAMSFLSVFDLLWVVSVCLCLWGAVREGKRSACVGKALGRSMVLDVTRLLGLLTMPAIPVVPWKIDCVLECL